MRTVFSISHILNLLLHYRGTSDLEWKLLLSYWRKHIENLYSPDKVHAVAKNGNKNDIKLTNLTKNNRVIHTARCDNKQYTTHKRSQLDKPQVQWFI